ncbi:hypothetical protein ASD77_12955 [Pseudoxanthomonas sp. Root65]|uniref:hypothetical protein n=1 Tax=Pseudoxanthomonas sp. Root65 TaxID=1736576 RepID=UPI0006FCA3A7|nr:hypothetical protein [Pseudoxanthomonas sp. Root65]KRA52548.1 hypothetical protein ASD77_12955 [Pseudoxanthomonas sp. Root65]
MELMAYLLADLWSKPRLLVPLLLGVVAGLGLFHLTGKEPASAAMALGCALLGLTVGCILEFLREPPRDPLD